MGIIRKKLWVTGRKGRRCLSVLFDSGSSFSLINDRIADLIGIRDEWTEPITCHAAVGAFTCREFIAADIKIRRHRPFGILTIVRDLTEEVIIGADFLQRWHIKLDPFRRRVIVDPRELQLRA